MSIFHSKSLAEHKHQIEQSLVILFIVTLSTAVGLSLYLLNKEIIIGLIGALGFFIFISVYLIVRKKLIYTSNIKKMEEVFPDFIELMASNLRAGMTVDQALLLSSRKEFAPLDTQILSLGKDMVTGKEIGIALRDMAKRIDSQKISKTILLIISGIVSGGNLSVLLEETASVMRERAYVEKKAASNVLMYAIFIFFAAGVGAPILFGLSSVLVDILSGILATLPPTEQLGATQLPFTFTRLSISPDFIKYFSLFFLCTITILAGMVLGLVNKGDAKAGIKYIPALLGLSIAIFFLIRFILRNMFEKLGAF